MSDTPTEIKRLYRSKKDRMLGGVCGGMAEYFNTDPVLIRILWVIFSLITAVLTGILAYAICWIIIPENPDQ
ncbi:hypothetical protein BEH94_05635 [Candidatus Altiarchaeales archaeon WOR_SM1_SCG]|nr:hypothetical protein BEH94_05635 [Candidatus Altiarchaeales archaeon WOR_SM1_SCG]